LLLWQGRFLQAGSLVYVQIIHDKDDFGRLRALFIQHFLNEKYPIFCGPSSGEFQMSATAQKLDFGKECCDAIAHILMVNEFTVVMRHSDRFEKFFMVLSIEGPFALLKKSVKVL
jgi:hypothetical protein